MSVLRPVQLPRRLARAQLRLFVRSALHPAVPLALRRTWIELLSRLQPPPPGTRVTESSLGGVPAERVEHNASGPGRAILFLHGGGYTIGSARTYRSLAGYLSRVAKAPVHSLDYRLAPEHPYPAALDDALAAYRALLDSGIDPGGVAIVGDSAGAGLALAVALRLRDAGEPLPGALALLSPWLDLTLSGDSILADAGRDAGINPAWLVGCAAAYCGGRDPADPELSPLFAELEGLPPLIVQAAAEEALVSDSDRLVQRARASGVGVSYRRFTGLWHTFHAYAGLLREAELAVEELGAELKRIWQAPQTVGSNGDGAVAALQPGVSGNGLRSVTPSVAIIGAGFAGIGMGMELKRAGIESFTIFERGDGVGGVWRDNTYPGATCDVPSHLYSFSEEPNHDWSRVYSPQPEILAYLEGLVRKYDLAEHLRFETEVARAEFDEDSGAWRIETAAGETMEADVLVSACGQLSRPAYPKIAGLEKFKGTQFHSARWEHDFDPAGKRVATIGTGASAIQFVPAIAPVVERLHVFQRSAPYVIPKKDRPYRAWEKKLFERLPLTQSLHRLWIFAFFEFFVTAFARARRLMVFGRRMFDQHFDEQVVDPALREALMPQDEIGCKRLLISSEYYLALQRPNVELVTTPIAEVTASGVVTEDGLKREVDAIVLGTGFQTLQFLAPMEIRGRDGLDLNDAWREGAEAYLGISVAGFPNLFMLYGPNTNLGAGSIIYMLESQIAYVIDAVRALTRGDAALLEVDAGVQSEFNRDIQQRLEGSVWQTGCSNWYVNESGRNTNNWPGWQLEYRRRTRRVDLADYGLGPLGERSRQETIATEGRG